MFWLLSLLIAASVGVTLGLVGGGSSILSVPLMMHVLGVSSPHVAIGTTGVAGGILGSRLALRLSARKNLLARVFAMLVAAVGVYVSIASWQNL